MSLGKYIYNSKNGSVFQNVAKVSKEASGDEWPSDEVSHPKRNYLYEVKFHIRFQIHDNT